MNVSFNVYCFHWNLFQPSPRLWMSYFEFRCYFLSSGCLKYFPKIWGTLFLRKLYLKNFNIKKQEQNCFFLKLCLRLQNLRLPDGRQNSGVLRPGVRSQVLRVATACGTVRVGGPARGGMPLWGRARLLPPHLHQQQRQQVLLHRQVRLQAALWKARHAALHHSQEHRPPGGALLS